MLISLAYPLNALGEMGVPGNCPILNEAPTPTRAGQFWLLATGVSLLVKSKTKSLSSGSSS